MRFLAISFIVSVGALLLAETFSIATGAVVVVGAAAVNRGDDYSKVPQPQVAAAETATAHDEPNEKPNQSEAQTDAAAAAAKPTEAATVSGSGSAVVVTEQQHSGSEVAQFLQRVQNTLEKAKPWVEEIEKEAKRLEETAKRFGEGVFSRLGEFVDKLIGSGESGSDATSSILGGLLGDGAGTTTTTTAAPATEAAVVDIKNDSVTASTTVDPADAAAAAGDDDTLDNEISAQAYLAQNERQPVCPDGFVADVNGICQRVLY